jgi:hypothetical protein
MVSSPGRTLDHRVRNLPRVPARVPPVHAAGGASVAHEDRDVPRPALHGKSAVGLAASQSSSRSARGRPSL